MSLYNDIRINPLVNPGGDHVALQLVIDVSGSMTRIVPEFGKSSIQLVTEAINGMIAELKADEHASKCCDISIITFTDPGAHKIILPFTSVSQVGPISLTTGGSTYAVDALKLAVQNIRACVKQYQGGVFKPWLVFISDGEIFDDLSAIGAVIRQRESVGKLRAICLGSDDYRPDQLKKISDKVGDLRGHDWKAFFRWLSKSMVIVSSSDTSVFSVKIDPTVPSSTNPSQKAVTWSM